MSSLQHGIQAHFPLWNPKAESFTIRFNTTYKQPFQFQRGVLFMSRFGQKHGPQIQRFNLMGSRFRDYVKADVSFKGLDKIHKRLSVAVDRIERGTMRDALNKAASPMLKASKDRARLIQRTGTLRKSLKRKIITDVSRQSVSVLIGPDRRVTSTDYAGKHTPANIIHLIEFGFNHKSGKRIEGKKFLEAAFEETKEETIKTYHRELGTSVEKVIKQFQKKDEFLR